MPGPSAADLLDNARRALGAEPDARVRAQIERLAEHVAAVDAFPLPDETPPYFPSPRPLTAATTLAPRIATEPPAQAGPLHALGAAEIARLVAARRVSVEEVARATLDRIAATERTLQAWVWVDREAVIADAKKLDAIRAATWPRGPLHGVPIGVKDTYDVAGMPTRAGSRVLADAPIATRDSWLVARLRAAGALIVGKTATTEFAASDPAGTRNPWNPAHTPGGSSSGSAAAVAAQVVPLALGTQTAGSVIRPASFCGVVGFKPSWGRVPLDRVIPFAWSLDTAGWFARTVEDAALVWRAIGGMSGAHRIEGQIRGFTSAPDPFAEIDARGWTSLAGYEALMDWQAHRDTVTPDPAMSEAVESAARSLNRAGGIMDTSSRANLLFLLAALDSQQVLMASEVAGYHERRYREQHAMYGPHVGALIATGTGVPATTLLRAGRVRRWLRANALQRLHTDTSDFWLLPAAAGPAPEGLDSTGDPSFNAPWTQFGFPAITLFAGLNAQGLPLGVQLVGRPGEDADLLATATWCEGVLGAAPAPPEIA